MDYNLCVLSELNYKKAHPELKEDEVLPLDWYASNDYILKIKLIDEALSKNVLVEELPGFCDIIEKHD